MSKQPPISKKQMELIHPRIPDAYEKLEAGRVTRREFVRFATLLGMSASLAVACGSAGDTEPAAPAAQEAAEETSVEATGPTRGGILRVGMELGQVIDHPARLSWIQGANVVRQVAEYLTETGSDNITRPYLLESWSANDDVSVWTLNLRQGIMFNNGDELTADDIMFNFGQWLDEEVGSSMLGLLSYIGGMQNIEKVDDYTIRLNLDSANIAVPENLFHYPGAIMHRDFEGDFIKSPVGTGPFILTDYAPDERVVFERNPDYWGGPSGNSDLPYLDGITYVNMDKDAAAAALLAGDVHTLYQPRPADWQAMKDNANIQVKSASTAQTVLLRARTDMEPWNDIRVINALKMAQDRQKILNLAYFGEGDLGADAHIAPVHPDYAPRDVPARDAEGARKLMEEWAADTGNSLPLKATLVTKNDEGEAEFAQVLKEDALDAGFDLALDITEPGGYWERWDEVPLGITAWTHRPIATMVLPLAYIADADGNPVPWNETRWVDDEFVEVLREAEGTLDIEARRELVGRLQDIFLERGPIGVSFFKSVWRLASTDVKGIDAHPTNYDIFTEVSLG